MTQKFDDKVLDKIVYGLKRHIHLKPIITLFVVRKLVLDNNYYVLDENDTRNYFFYLNANKSLPIADGEMCSAIMKSEVPINVKTKPVRVSMFTGIDPNLIFVKRRPLYHFTTIYTNDFIVENVSASIIIYCYSWSSNKEDLEIDQANVKEIETIIAHVNSLRGNKK